MKGVCALCGRYGELECHHLFGGPLRKKSEKYGLVIFLCHSCHNEPPNGAHHNAKTMQKLHEYGQRVAMKENGWTIDDFRKEFYKNYLEVNNDSNNQ
mgnify:FL=1